LKKHITRDDALPKTLDRKFDFYEWRPSSIIHKFQFMKKLIALLLLSIVSAGAQPTNHLLSTFNISLTVTRQVANLKPSGQDIFTKQVSAQSPKVTVEKVGGLLGTDLTGFQFVYDVTSNSIAAYNYSTGEYRDLSAYFTVTPPQVRVLTGQTNKFTGFGNIVSTGLMTVAFDSHTGSTFTLSGVATITENFTVFSHKYSLSFPCKGEEIPANTGPAIYSGSIVGSGASSFR
jgi:hypothetical protein